MLLSPRSTPIGANAILLRRDLIHAWVNVFDPRRAVLVRAHLSGGDLPIARQSRAPNPARSVDSASRGFFGAVDSR